MPPIIKAIGNVIPLTYYIRIARGIITKGVGIRFLWSDVAALAICGTVTTTLAAIPPQKTSRLSRKQVRTGLC
jgi:drug efflux transport system permease protein